MSRAREEDKPINGPTGRGSVSEVGARKGFREPRGERKERTVRGISQRTVNGANSSRILPVATRVLQN